MRIFVFTLFFIVFSSIEAQTYVPMLSSLNEWQLTSCASGCLTDIYYIDGDTSINNLNYKVLNGYHYIERTFWLRESIPTRKVYLSYANSDKNRSEKLLYDFSLQVNDSIKMYNPISPFDEDSGFYKVDSIISRILNDGNSYNHFYFSPSISNNISFEKPIWIEGLGTLSMINAPGGGPNVNGAGKVSCYFKDDILVYTQTDSIQGCSAVNYLNSNAENTHIDFTIYPNPTSENLTVKSALNILQLQIMSIDGRLLLTTKSKTVDVSSLTAGNYILQINFEGQKTQFKKISKQ